MRELEDQLKFERQKVETLENDSSKLFEAEEALLKSRDEVAILKTELGKTSENIESSNKETKSTQGK